MVLPSTPIKEMQQVWYRFFSYLGHVLTAWNTTGEGIHSPYLFHIVRFLMRDKNSYYCFAEIERRRATLAASEEVLNVMDYGSAGSPKGTLVQRRVCDITRTHLESPKIGQFLFRLVTFMGEQEKRPLMILELGTSLGITTAYLAAADSKNKVTTLEGSEALAAKAEQQWAALGLQNIRCVTGRIENTLYRYARAKVDVAYMDANHTYPATMSYADALLPRLTEKGVLVIDDIHYSPEMARAWKELKADTRVTTSMDLWHCGLLFVDPHYLKRNYRIRI